MINLEPYLVFNGNCGDAMTFYKDCLGGELILQRVKETPMASQLPADKQEHVMHSLLKSGGVNIMASDMMKDGISSPAGAETISLCLNCESEEELRAVYTKLAQGGNAVHEPKQEFWGDVYGDLTDKFGIRWMFNYHKPKES